MRVFLASYDLKTPGQNYPELIQALSSIGKRILLSAWIVQSNLIASQLRNALLQHMDANDDIIVIEIMADSYDWATFARVSNPGVALLSRVRP